MGTIGLSKANRLFWLGRYFERVYTLLKATRPLFEAEVDGMEADFGDYCRRMGIKNDYSNTGDFIRRYYFEKENGDSVISALYHAYDNAVVLRETLRSDTLAYVQMALTAMEMAAGSAAPAVELQWVLDDIMAFRGSCEENIEEEICRNIIKAGTSIERVDIYLRLGYPQKDCARELAHLASRMKKARLNVNEENLRLLKALIEGKADGIAPEREKVAALEGIVTGI